MHRATPGRPTIDPVSLVKEPGGEERLYRLLVGVGYRPQAGVFDDFVLSLLLGHGWLVGGPKGAGKTAFPRALIRACNLPWTRLQGREGLKPEQVLYFWDRAAQDQFIEQEVRLRGRDLGEAQRESWTRRFLRLGAVPEAFDHAARTGERVVSFFDEEDKCPSPQKDFLLSLLEEGSLEVPELEEGYVGFGLGDDTSSWPIVIATSNEQRNDADDPFRSRFSVYTPISLPTEREQVEIIRLQVPGAGKRVVLACARVLAAAQGMGSFVVKPGVREILALAAAFVKCRVEAFDEKTIVRMAGVIAKRRSDVEAVKQGACRLAEAAESPNPELDRHVDDLFGGSDEFPFFAERLERVAVAGGVS